MEKKRYFIVFWWLKGIFDTSRLFQMVKYGILKKQVYSSILKVWQIWLQIAKHNPWKEVVWEKDLILYCSDD